jgi:hypothetical protein
MFVAVRSRCLVTADRGFGNRMRFNPSDYAGIVVIRLPSRPTFEEWREAIETLILGLEQAEVEGKLWIIQQGTIQEYQPIEPEDTESMNEDELYKWLNSPIVTTMRLQLKPELLTIRLFKEAIKEARRK